MYSIKKEGFFLFIVIAILLLFMGFFIYFKWNSSLTGAPIASGSQCGTVNNNITLTQDITVSGACFTINANNIVINGAGYKITGDATGLALSSTGFANVSIKNFAGMNNFTGIYLANTQNFVIINNSITTANLSGARGIILNDSSHSLISSNTITVTTAIGSALLMAGDSGNNTLLNNNLIAAQVSEIVDNTNDDVINYLIYNNSFGDLRWIDNGSGSFVRNLTLDVNNELGLGLDRNLFIGNNTVALNTSAFSLSRINSTANLTLGGLPFYEVKEIRRIENYSTDSNFVVNNGNNCNGTSCSFISYANGTLLFNTSSFSSFAALEEGICGIIVRDTVLHRNIITNNSCYVIGNNITLDGNGYSVLGNGSGISIFVNDSYDAVTIQNFAGIANFSVGIQFNSVQNSLIKNSTITPANVSNGYGIFLNSSGSNTISSNTISAIGANGYGIYLLSSSSNTISSNALTTSGTNARGISLESSSHSNTISSNMITTSNSNADGIYLDGSHYATISWNSINTSSSNSQAINLLNSTGDTLSSNNINVSSTGTSAIVVQNADITSITITSNRIITQTSDAAGSNGIRLIGVQNNTIWYNVITIAIGNAAAALRLDSDTANNTFLNNNLSSAQFMELYDLSDDASVNDLIYNNSFGDIRWIDNGSGSFLRNLTLDVINNQGLGLDRNIFIGSNVAGINASAINNSYSKMNSSASIILQGLAFSDVNHIQRTEDYSTDSDFIVSNGNDCLGSSCQILSYSSGRLLFNTSSFSSFAAHWSAAPSGSSSGGSGSSSGSSVTPSSPPLSVPPVEKIPDEELFPPTAEELKQDFAEGFITVTTQLDELTPEDLAVWKDILSPQDLHFIQKFRIAYQNNLSSPVTLTINLQDYPPVNLPQEEQLVRKLKEQLLVFLAGKDIDALVGERLNAIKWMQYEQMQNILGKAIGRTRHTAGIVYSGNQIQGRLLTTAFLNCNDEQITLQPHERIEKSCFMRKEFSLRSRPPLKLAISAQGEKVFEQPLPRAKQDIIAEAVVDVANGNALDIYTTLPPSNNEEFLMEININQPLMENTSSWFNRFWLKQSEFSDIYGPYHVPAEGLFLVQQFEYDPQLYQGEQEVSIQLYKEGKKIGENKYQVVLGKPR